MRARNKNKRLIIIICLMLALLLTGSVLAFRKFHKTASKSPTNPSPNNTTQTNPSNSEEPSGSSQTSPGSSSSNSSSTSVNSSSGSSKTAVTATITTLAVSGQTVIVRAYFTPPSAATCTVTFQKGSQKIERSAPATVQGQTSVCQGFDIEKGAFSPGTWSVTIKVNSDAVSGVSDTQTIAI